MYQFLGSMWVSFKLNLQVGNYQHTQPWKRYIFSKVMRIPFLQLNRKKPIHVSIFILNLTFSNHSSAVRELSPCSGYLYFVLV
jgi:hypothetical protein